MKRITNHATDRASSRTGNRSEYDMDPDLVMKAGAFRVAHKRSYAGTVRQQGGGYQTRRTLKKSRWQMYQMGKAAEAAARPMPKPKMTKKQKAKAKAAKKDAWYQNKKGGN